MYKGVKSLKSSHNKLYNKILEDYMSLAVILFTALALSMDAFTVSVTKGMSVKNLTKGLAIKIALFFGVFQGLMPLIGWLLGVSFEKYIKSIDHWIALVLLSYLGFRMIREFIEERKTHSKGLAREGDSCSVELSTNEIIMLSIATSIDALAVGISFAFSDVNIIQAALAITVVTFIMCLIGVFMGRKIGNVFNGYADLLGGVILIFIGLSIFNEHTNLINDLLTRI